MQAMLYPPPLPRLSEPDVVNEITAELKRLGFRYVTLDLEGFRSGSLNAVLPAGSLVQLSAAGRAATAAPTGSRR